MFINNQDMETTQVPTNRRVDKDMLHIHNEILYGYKKE